MPAYAPPNEARFPGREKTICITQDLELVVVFGSKTASLKLLSDGKLLFCFVEVCHE